MIYIRYYNNKRHDRFVLYVFAFIIFTFISLTIIGTIISNMFPTLNSVTEYNQGWTHTDGSSCSLNKFKSSKDLTKESHFIYKTIPASNQDFTFAFRARNMFINVYSDETLLYKEDTTLSKFFGSTRGTEWYFISIPAHSSEITLSIECITIYGNTHGVLDDMYLGPFHDVLNKVISLHIIGFIISNVLLFISIGLTCFYLYLHYKHVDDKALLYLGIAVFFTALWSNMESLLWPLFGGNAELSHLLSYLSLVTIPIPLSLLGYVKLEGKQKFFCKMLYYICTANFIITSTLHFTGILEFHYTLYPTYILFIILMFVSLLLSFHFIHGNDNVNSKKILLLGVILVSVSAILEIIRYLTDSYSNYSSITRIGIIIIIICFFILYTNKLLDILRKNAQSEMIHEIALRDVMTQLLNRTALTEDFTFYEDLLQHGKSIGVLQFDVNNLKPVNDKFGHEKGDQLLIVAAQCISKGFSSIGKCYRTGGDEFLVILTGNSPEKDCETGMEIFEHERLSHNNICAPELHLDIAHGFIVDSNTTLKSMIKIADSLMYENKKILKKQV